MILNLDERYNVRCTIYQHNLYFPMRGNSFLYIKITFNIGYIGNLEHMYFVSMKVALIKAS